MSKCMPCWIRKKSSMNSKEEFIERNSKIYEGIEMSDLSITDITVKDKKTEMRQFPIQQICRLLQEM